MKLEELIYDEERGLALDLYSPDEVTENTPLFVYFHGGGIENGSKSSGRQHWKILADEGIACASANYRMYPNAKFPDFIEDCARAIAFLQKRQKYAFVTVGGSSAGAYLAMMLFFDKHYLADAGADMSAITGWCMDAGQPTVHFNVLRERGLDTRLVRIDEAAPLYFIDKDFEGEQPHMVILSASNDMACRLEQLHLLEKTMLHFKYPKQKLHFYYMNGYKHCGYTGKPVFCEIVRDLIKQCRAEKK